MPVPNSYNYFMLKNFFEKETFTILSFLLLFSNQNGALPQNLPLTDSTGNSSHILWNLDSNERLVLVATCALPSD